MDLPEFLTRHEHGEIRLIGHRIGLFHVAELYRDGSSPEEIIQEFPTLPLSLVRQVVEFYRQHREEVDRYVDDCRAEVERQATAPPGPGLLKMRRLLEQQSRPEAE